MIKEQLKQYRAAKKEIEEIDNRISKLKTHTCVLSSAEFPYSKHQVKVSGYPTSRTSEILRLRHIQDNDRKLCRAVEEFIYSIEDVITRQIFCIYYIDGKHRVSWQYVANKIGEADEQYPRRKHNKYLKYAELPEFDENDEFKVL